MKSEEALKQTEAGIDELISALEQGRSGSLIQFLEFQARFHHYSFRNCLLIAVQNPAATYVAGFARWKQLDRHVRKGEKGLAILAPLVRKAKKDETSDGEEEVSESRTLRGFRTVFVFDVSQTEGNALPEFSRIHGDPGDKLRRLQSYVRDQGIGLTTVVSLGGAEGVSYGGRIEILENLDPAKEFAVTAHELAHELLHRTERRKETTRKIRELEAEAVAFVVSRAAGLDAKTHSADYIQLYSGDKEMLLQSLDHIQRVAAQIIAALELSENTEADQKSVSSKEAGKVFV